MSSAGRWGRCRLKPGHGALAFPSDLCRALAVHEVAMAQAVWRQVLDEMGRHQGHRLLALDLAVGAWSGADPESLQFALELVMKESRWSEAKVRIRREPLALACRRCGRQFDTDEPNLACPGCGGLDVEPVSGMEVRLESLEIE